MDSLVGKYVILDEDGKQVAEFHVLRVAHTSYYDVGSYEYLRVLQPGRCLSMTREKLNRIICEAMRRGYDVFEAFLCDGLEWERRKLKGLTPFTRGDLFTVQCVRYVYLGCKPDRIAGKYLHMAAEVGLSEDGKVFATDNVWYFTDEELSAANEPDPEHWESLVKAVLRIKYSYLKEAQIRKHTFNIVWYVFGIIPRFAERIPKLHELNGYIAEYMNEQED